MCRGFKSLLRYKKLNEIDEIYQSHLIYGEVRIRFNMLIFQGVCDQFVIDDTDVFLTYQFIRFA